MNIVMQGKSVRDGIGYFLIGQSRFFSGRDLWKYALLPLFFMALFYLLVFAGMVWLLTALTEGMENTSFGQSLSHLSVYLFFGVCVLLVWGTQNALYQCFGAFIFDALSEYYEKKEYGYTCSCPARQRRAAEWDSCLLSCRNFILGLGLMLVLFVSFGAVSLICTPLMGYLQGVSCFQACAVNHGMRLDTLRPRLHRHFLTITVFGTCTFLAQMIPFLSFVLTPGFFVGGCHLFRDKILSESDI